MRFLVMFGRVPSERMFFTRNASEALFWAQFQDFYLVIETTTNHIVY